MVEHRLAAVVPTLNEVAAIGDVVRGLRAAGACCVFVVDGGSIDATQEAAWRAGAVVVEERRPSYGRACLTGAEAAAGHELVAFLDGDGSCDPADLKMLECAAGQGADLVLGRRRHVQAGAIAWHARLGNRLVAGVLRARTSRPVHDVPPFKLVRADALASLGLDEAGYGWTVQLIGRALAHPALQVMEVPVRFRRREGGESKVSGRLGPSLRAARAMIVQAVLATRRRGLLVLMAKAPGGGSKTRLEADLGPGLTSGFWAACLCDAGTRLRQAAGAMRLYAASMTPSPEDAVEVRRLTGVPSLAQGRPGLGEALLEVSRLPAPFTVAISADVPTLPQVLVLAALGALRRRPAVLGPGVDGGYYLVGLRRGVSRRRREQAYLKAPMGTASVLEHTRTALGNVALLPPWPDVDSVHELRELARKLKCDPDQAPTIAAWLRDHGVRAEEAG